MTSSSDPQEPQLATIVYIIQEKYYTLCDMETNWHLDPDVRVTPFDSLEEALEVLDDHKQRWPQHHVAYQHRVIERTLRPVYQEPDIPTGQFKELWDNAVALHAGLNKSAHEQ